MYCSILFEFTSTDPESSINSIDIRLGGTLSYCSKLNIILLFQRSFQLHVKITCLKIAVYLLLIHIIANLHFLDISNSFNSYSSIFSDHRCHDYHRQNQRPWAGREMQEGISSVHGAGDCMASCIDSIGDSEIVPKEV